MNKVLGSPEVGSHLPNPSELRVDETKIKEYLLNSTHPEGAGKAKFFLGQGFEIANWADFADALREHACRNEIAKICQTEYGIKYIVECTITLPDKTANYCIRVVWNHHKDADAPRLVTAHPLSTR